MLRNQISSLAISLTTLMLVAGPASALTATQSVEREIVVKSADGTIKTTRVPADKVVPGEKVVYSLKYYNDQAEPAENIVLVMPIPKEIAFSDGSAEQKNAQTEYSVDGGKTFAARSDLKIRRRDGHLVVARATDITHIRWTVLNKVLPKTGGELVFSGHLK